MHVAFRSIGLTLSKTTLPLRCDGLGPEANFGINWQGQGSVTALDNADPRLGGGGAGWGSAATSIDPTLSSKGPSGGAFIWGKCNQPYGIVRWQSSQVAVTFATTTTTTPAPAVCVIDVDDTIIAVNYNGVDITSQLSNQFAIAKPSILKSVSFPTVHGAYLVIYGSNSAGGSCSSAGILVACNGQATTANTRANWQSIGSSNALAAGDPRLSGGGTGWAAAPVSTDATLSARGIQASISAQFWGRQSQLSDSLVGHAVVRLGWVSLGVSQILWSVLQCSPLLVPWTHSGSCGLKYAVARWTTP